MGALPVAADCRSHLEGYNITTSILSDAWITDVIANTIVPYWENITGMSLSAETEVIEYLSGNGTSILMLNRRPVNSIEDVSFVIGGDSDALFDLSSVELIAAEGIIKRKYSSINYRSRLWPKGEKNIKVTYKYGGSIANDIEMALKKLACIEMLGLIEGRTGGGDLSVQNFGRGYGNRGKYTNIRNDFSRKALFTVRKYSTAVSGS